MPRVPTNASAERRQLGKVDDHRVVVNLLDLNVLVAANGHGSRCGSEAYSQLNTTSSAVNGLPSCA